MDEQTIIQALKVLNPDPDGIPGGQLINRAVNEKGFRSRDVRSAIMAMLEDGELAMVQSGNLVLKQPVIRRGV